MNEVHQHLLQAGGIGQDDGQIGRGEVFEGQSCPLGLQTHALHRGGGDVLRGNGSPFQGNAPGLDAG